MSKKKSTAQSHLTIAEHNLYMSMVEEISRRLAMHREFIEISNDGWTSSGVLSYYNILKYYDKLINDGFDITKITEKNTYIKSRFFIKPKETTYYFNKLRISVK